MGTAARPLLGYLKRQAAPKLRLLAPSRTYRIPGTVKIVPVADPAEFDYPADQYAELEITDASAAAPRWTGVAVRSSAGGQEAYVGICRTGRGKSEFILCKRTRGKLIRLGPVYRGAPRADGIRLRLVALGSTISLMENEVTRVAVGDKSLSGGIPGVLLNGAVPSGKWSGGPADFEVRQLAEDARGIVTYSIFSAANSGGPHLLRVLRPANPKRMAAHNFLIVLPVEAGLRTVYGDGLQELQSLDAHNHYNVTIVEPSFGLEPWYADNPGEPDVRYETFLVTELLPWVRATLAVTGDEQTWLLGFSKSGLGGQALLMRHPDRFDLAACWDFPADMSAHDEYGPGSAACYGTDVNFLANYRLTSEFVESRSTPFRTDCRIWIDQGQVFADNVARYESILAGAGVRYMTGGTPDGPHRWDGGWLPAALAALQKCSIELARAQSGGT
jgi:Putative esterase